MAGEDFQKQIDDLKQRIDGLPENIADGADVQNLKEEIQRLTGLGEISQLFFPLDINSKNVIKEYLRNTEEIILARLIISPTTANAIQIDPFGVAAGNTSEFRLLELAANGANFTGFKSPDSLAADIIYILPTADGAANQQLTTDSSGVLSWSSSGEKINIINTQVDVINTTTETNLFSESISGGTLGSTNGIRGRAYISQLNRDSGGGTDTVTIRLKYGSTTIASFSLNPSTTQARGYIPFAVIADGSTTAQKGFVSLDTDLTDIDGADEGTATENSANDLNLVISAQWNAARANNRLVSFFTTIETIR